MRFANWTFPQGIEETEPLDYDQQQLQNLQEGLRKANRELSKTERELDNLKKAKPTDPVELAKWRKNINNLNKKHHDLVNAVQKAQMALDKHVEIIGLENLSLAEFPMQK